MIWWSERKQKKEEGRERKSERKIKGNIKEILRFHEEDWFTMLTTKSEWKSPLARTRNSRTKWSLCFINFKATTLLSSSWSYARCTTHVDDWCKGCFCDVISYLLKIYIICNIAFLHFGLAISMMWRPCWDEEEKNRVNRVDKKNGNNVIKNRVRKIEKQKNTRGGNREEEI